MFPFSIKGSIPIQPGGIAATNLSTAIGEDLTRQRIKHRLVESCIIFENWSFAIWSVERYAVVERGRFTIRPDAIEYSLQTRVLFILTALTATLVAMALYLTTSLSLPTQCAITVGVWLYLFGVNYFLIWLRTRLFLRKLVQSR